VESHAFFNRTYSSLDICMYHVRVKNVSDTCQTVRDTCDVLNKKETIKVTIAARFTQGPSSSSSFYRSSISPGAFLDFLLCSRLFIPSAKMVYFPPLISWGFIFKCSWWKVTSSEDVSRDSRKQLHSRKRRIIL
jgi:hypothetical protein